MKTSFQALNEKPFVYSNNKYKVSNKLDNIETPPRAHTHTHNSNKPNLKHNKY